MAAVDELVAVAANLTLRSPCSRGCASCCQPRFVFFDDDLSEAELSAAAKRKFYVVKKGRPGSEAIYSHWDLAKVHVLGISGALHQSCGTGDEARQIWADFCHNNHQHAPRSTPRRANTVRRPEAPPPPPYSPMTAPSPRPAPVTPTSRRLSTPSATLDRFYRVSGSPRVLIHAREAETELRSSLGATLLVEASLEAIEDDDEVVPVDTRHFYRVFGSSRVQSSREAALAELVDTAATGLWVGDSLDAVME